MIKVMVGSAGTSPKRTTSPDSASTEATHIPSHRRFNRPAAVYGRAIPPERPLEQQPPETANQSALEQIRMPGAKNRPVVLLLFLAVLLVAATVTFTLAYFRDHRLTAVETAPSVQAMPDRSVRLGMRAHEQGRDLLLSWDGKSQAVQSGTDGLLQIDDGAQHRQIALDRGAIASCSMLYTPTSDDVVFRLEIRGKEGVRGAESLEVVGTRARTPDLEVPPMAPSTEQAKPEPNTPNTEKLLSHPVLPNRHGSKKTNAANPVSQTVKRRTPKLSEAPGRVPRPASQPVAAEKAPSLPMASVTAAQPSPFSAQPLPKPPPEPSTKSANHPTETAGSPAKASSPASYIPPRPLKWTAPNAKSLGISKMSAATDVQIKVRIDDSGRVTSAHALLDGSPHDEAVTAAVTAAVKQWIFEPAKMQGKNVPSEETVVIRVGPRE